MAAHSQALIYATLVVAIAAPIAGATIRSRPTLMLGLAMIVGASLAAQLLLPGPVQAIPIFAGDLTLAAVGLALAAVGRLLGSLFADPLDAIGSSVVIAASLTCGLFAIGPLASGVPTPLLNLGLLTNPVVAVSASGNVDVFRSELLYQMSPIAHREFDYPTWYAATGFFFTVAATASLTAAYAHRRRVTRQFINSVE
jgi:hypothetical protein